jgi:hypothetical protein
MLRRPSNDILARGRASRLATLGILGVLSLVASPAFAVSPAMTDGTAPESHIQKVHYCHRSCEYGYIPRWGVSRWHRHIGPACLPERCVPRAPNPERCWVDAAGVRHCRW